MGHTKLHWLKNIRKIIEVWGWEAFIGKYDQILYFSLKSYHCFGSLIRTF